MAFSHLYSAVIRGKWFIDLRGIEPNRSILERILEHSHELTAEEDLSTRKKLSLQMSSTSDGGEQTQEDVVAIIPLHGTMMKYGSLCTYGTTEIADLIYEAADNPKISGILLDIDSGGGAVDAIAPLTDALEYNRKKGKSSVACCDLCASAAYFTAIACDEIIASNAISSEFGSIGVMMSFPDYAKYYENEGIKVHTIYSSLSDYKNAPFELAKKGDYSKIKEEELDPLARKFQDAVKNSRGDKLQLDTEGLLRGRTFYAEEALKVGLIDAIGNREFAISRVKELRRDADIESYIKSKL